MSRKDYLISKEKKEVLKKHRIPLMFFDVARFALVIYIFLLFKKYIRHQMYSLREPDYLYFGGLAVLCIAAFTLLSVGKSFYRSKVLSSITIQEKKNDEKAEIKDNLLVLSNSEGEVRFDISRIRNLESKDGRTSFTYYDPKSGKIDFSCLDYYEPQIAKMLIDKGIR